MPDYDAILLVSFGGPEGPDDVIPFLENVLRGKNVPRERMLEVAEHYQHFGGVSPINGQNRALLGAIEAELREHGNQLPIYWGNRNWHPLLPDAIQQMKADGIQRALALVTSALSSYSGCRQYRENIEAARAHVGAGAPEIHKLRVFYNHPGFIEPMVANVNSALSKVPAELRDATPLLFAAHSIPNSMAAGCAYETQHKEASRLVAQAVGPNPWHCVYQSRSGPPHQPWLEPDICDFIRELHGEAGGPDSPIPHIVVVPIGFISDHMEVMFDLDLEARELCEELGIQYHRAATVGTDPGFVTMIRELIDERLSDEPHRRSLGDLGPSHDVCPEDCCLMGASPGRPRPS